MKKTKLKGGSLSSTWLIENDNGTKFVRKECSITENREYGYQRWYSQLKRQQRYNVMFPGLFPLVYKTGVEKNVAYFEMEYIEGAKTVFDYLCLETDENKIINLLEKILMGAGLLHGWSMRSHPAIMELYLEEEVGRKWLDAECDRIICSNNEFKTTDGEVPMFDLTGFYKEMGKYSENEETFTHGNLTLENILYVRETGRVVFIDPYEENIIDSKLCDYSQLLQSCSSNYELFNNSHEPVLENGVINFNVHKPMGLVLFNIFYTHWLEKTLTPDQFDMVRLFEISQFIRMLPFKKEIDSQKMVFFYALASKKFEEFKASEK